MATYKTTQNLFARGPHQTDYKTETAIADNSFRQIVQQGYSKPQYDSPNVPNEGESTGTAYSSITYKDKDMVAWQGVQEQLTFQLLGLLAYDAFGVTTTAVIDAFGGVFKHTFKLLDPHVSNVLPVRPIFAKTGDPVLDANNIYNKRYPSMMVSAFSLTDSGDKPNLVSTTDYQGSGAEIDPSGVQPYGAGKDIVHQTEYSPFEEPIRKKGLATIYPAANLGGTAIATDCLMKSFSASINENLDQENAYNCVRYQDGNNKLGQIAGQMYVGRQEVSYEFTMIADSAMIAAFDLKNRLKAGTEFSLKNLFEGSVFFNTFKHEAVLKLMKAKIASINWQEVGGGTEGFTIQTQPLSNGNVMPLELDVQTNVADFATYIAQTA